MTNLKKNNIPPAYLKTIDNSYLIRTDELLQPAIPDCTEYTYLQLLELAKYYVNVYKEDLPFLICSLVYFKEQKFYNGSLFGK